MTELLSYAWPLWLSNIALNALGLPFLRRRDKAISERLFGGSATWGGVALSVALGSALWLALPSHELIFWKAVSACVGHMIASFIKRRLGVPRGAYVPFLAHGDYILAFALISAVAGSFDDALALEAYFVTILGTPLVTYFFHKTRLRKDPL